MASLITESPSTPAGGKSTDSVLTNTDVFVARYADLFYKTEHEAYLRLGDHPRILRYHGWDRRGLLFDKHPAGDLLNHLLVHRYPPPSLSVRLQWACDIAEGLAFLHSKGVIWVDVSLSNILLSDDSTRAVLCDFAGSCILPIPGQKALADEYKESQVALSPMVCMPRYQHAMLWEGPGSPYPHPDWNFELLEKIAHLHLNETFDTLGEVEEYAKFEQIIQKCFRAEYLSSDDLAEDVKAACAAMAIDAPLLQDRIQDPVLEFAPSGSGRRLFPFEDGFEEEDFEVDSCEDFHCACGTP
ncbi:kinase-like domain-containing protein [Mycena sp. CBHHK59/15]|nr:kinase-like domain-containing protein [Mycena sp. CBHHK59/15]